MVNFAIEVKLPVFVQNQTYLLQKCRRVELTA
nr:MAG TPA: hypothetical protein [Caudoviricetes sp.]